MAVLNWSQESELSPFTKVTVSPHIQPAVGVLLDSRNAASASM